MAQAPAVLAPDQVLGFVLLDVALILVAATLLGAVARRFGQPTVVGHIVAGVVLGPTLLGPTIFQWGNPWHFLHCDVSLQAAATPPAPSVGNCLFPPQAKSVLSVLGQIALVFYMFLVGCEVKYAMLKGRAKSIGTVAVAVIAIPIALGFLIGPFLYDSKWVANFGDADLRPSRLAFYLMVGAILSVTAFPVMAHILQEKGLATSPMGSVGIAATATLSVMMFLAVAVASAIARDQSTGDIITKLVVAGLFVAFLFYVVKPALAPLGRQIEAQGRLGEVQFAFIFILLFFGSYAADRMGINVIPGAFLVGVILPAREIVFAEMRTKLRDVTIFVLLPIFLAVSGLNTDFTKLGSSFIVGILVVLVAGIAGKWLAGAGSARLSGLNWAEGNVIGVLMNCRGLLVLVVALIALNDGVISPQLQVAAVLMALITTGMTGPLFDKFSEKLPSYEAPLPVPVDEPHTMAQETV